MALTISGVSALDTQMSQMQSQAQMQTQSMAQSSNASFGSDSVSLSEGNSEYDTYTSNGNMSKAEFSARVVNSTLERLNSNPFGSSASSESYQFSKDVLSAYSKY
ncbi:MAG TPA: hypothetical protein PKJ08_00455 [Candidatus Cloacimonadota bacterium]|jgi:Tfp pilus assembly protein PilV|nr:hypothetical protein [Candidatus Cloacimonadota bacterium]